MNVEERTKFDRALADFERLEEQQVNALSVTSKRKKVPPWWKGDAGASESSMQAARDLGYVVGASQ